MNDFETLLTIAHERLVMLDDLRAMNITIVRMQGIAIGAAGTALLWIIWRLL